MTRWKQITADDGHRLSVYIAGPESSGAPGLVLLQEIFGVTRELEELAERYAGAGFRVAIPALYDRIQLDLVLPYEDTSSARAAKNQLRYDEIDVDIKAAMDHVETGHGLGLLGYCWGGGLAYWMAQRHCVDAIVSYYGTNIQHYCSASSTPTARCQFHFGVDDSMIETTARNTVRKSCREMDEYFEYEAAGHAFANVARPSYRSQAAALAESRTLEFLGAALRGVAQ